MAKDRSRPTILPEKRLAERLGGAIVAGVDEAGRGPIAGPVVAAAVIFDPAKRRPIGINDSKRIAPAQRLRLAEQIKRSALSWSIASASAQEIDLINILEATRLAATRAVRGLTVAPTALVTDYLILPDLHVPIEAMVKGDSISVSVAAASILAKTHRDALLDRYHEDFPEYGFDRHRGYPTAEHYAAVRAHGPTTLHRMTFAGVDFFCGAPRRSLTHQRISKRLACLDPRDEITLRSLAEEVERLSPALPVPDLIDLQERIREHPSRNGAPL